MSVISTTDRDTARIDAALDALLAEFDPKKVDNVTFRGARFDKGLAWVHFPEGHGGLGMRPDLNRRVEERLRAAGAAAATGALAGVALSPAASTNKTTEPCLTLSPNFTRSSFTTPAVEDGISIDALSDSTVINDCSAFTVSPTLTNSSMTATSSKSPMSGTLTSTNAMCVSKSF